ncbi:unnamed protein product [Heligmosomoides polygyrus]|uniref:SCP domain-containing protein n=1 Tax=Heligmosomoides polygyrus TaxID=6339 RepID=A0A183FAB3_HELPZ|nr:unnamed protein product [Heligmosomoides polygyrus]
MYVTDSFKTCFRSQVAKGEAKNPLTANGYSPKAARMRKMVYDCNIEANAMIHAHLCTYRHSPMASRPYLGENLHWLSSTRSVSPEELARNASDWWFAELKEFGVPEDNVFTARLLNTFRPIGHYTQVPSEWFRSSVDVGARTTLLQMTWQTTYHLGCAIVQCSRKSEQRWKRYYTVCQYGPPGNLYKRPIYEKGEPCKSNSDCKCDGCRCDREAALCVMPPSLPWTAQKGIVPA